MSYLEYNTQRMPKGAAKVLHLNWALVVLLIAVACYGFVMLYSVAGGSTRPWMELQMQRFGVGACGDVRRRHGADLVLAVCLWPWLYAVFDPAAWGRVFRVGGHGRATLAGTWPFAPATVGTGQDHHRHGACGLLRLGRYQEDFAPGIRVGRGDHCAVPGLFGRAPAGPWHLAADCSRWRCGDLRRRRALGLFRGCHRFFHRAGRGRVRLARDRLAIAQRLPVSPDRCLFGPHARPFGRGVSHQPKQ